MKAMRRPAMVRPVCAGLSLALAFLAGCDSDPCSTPEKFQVYAPAFDASGIPLCTAANNPDAEATEVEEDGGSYTEFPGSAPVSSAAAAQCAVLCTGALSTLPCCLSVWE